LLEGYKHLFAENVASSPTNLRRDGIVLQNHHELLSALKPDVLMVMGWFPRGCLRVFQWAGSAGVPLVCRGESNLVLGRSLAKRFAKAFYFRCLFQKFACFSVIGRNYEFYRHYGVPEGKLLFAPYSVHTGFFESEFQLHRANRRTAGPWWLGFAGKLTAKRGRWIWWKPSGSSHIGGGGA
jgi:hypothetical protein